MNYTKSEITFPSSDRLHTVHAEIFSPTIGAPRAVVQISHGMIDHISRYEGLADFLTANGFAVAGNDHLGHGRTADGEGDFGFFARRGGVDYVLDDLHTMNATLRERFPGLPVFLFGHSMGSFLARLFVEKYPADADALIIHGTGGSNPALPVGKCLVHLISTFRGPRHRSRMVANLAFTGYNSRFPKEEGRHAWLTRDASARARYAEDPYTRFTFTVSAYGDLFRMVGASNSRAWYINYPKDLPTLIMSGDADPVGAYGKGPQTIHDKLLAAGVGDLTLHLYKDARHELFNEVDRHLSFSDLLTFLEHHL